MKGLVPFAPGRRVHKLFTNLRVDKIGKVWYNICVERKEVNKMNYLMLDTETTNDIDCPFVYDLGYAVINDEGEKLKEGSLVIADIFLDKELMTSAYFHEKIPKYWEEIKAGTRHLTSWRKARNEIYNTMCDFDITYVVAHNARFDYRSTVTTQRYLTSSKFRYFFPYGTKFIDTLKMSRLVFKNDENYQEFCHENGFMCGKNKTSLRFTAESLYCYLTNNPNFAEKHTALEDVNIEKDIFMECLKHITDTDGLLW